MIINKSDLIALSIMIQVASAADARWLIVEGFVLIVLVILNILLNGWEGLQMEVEMRKRMEHVLRQLIYVRDQGINWTTENFPHLHTPLSD